MAVNPLVGVVLLAVYFMFVSSEDIGPLLHISIEPEHLFKHGDDEYYVRFYQTVFDPIDDAGVSTTDFLTKYNKHGKNANIYKDIWRDSDGRIIIMPGLSSKGSLSEGSYWFGVGDYRNQLKFMQNYKNQGASTPLVRSFLVKYDAVQKILDRNHITDENNFKYKIPNGKKFDKTLALNVDKYLPNQFGFGEWDMEEVRRNILADSLVTYAFNPDQIPGDHTHWGPVLDIEELYHGLGIEGEVPGLLRDASTRQHMEKDLKNILSLYEPDIPDTDSIEKNIQKFNDKYKNSMYEIQELKSKDILAVKELKEKVTESLKIDKETRSVWLKNMAEDLTELAELDRMKDDLKKIRNKGSDVFASDNKINELKVKMDEKINEYNNKYLQITKEKYHLKEEDMSKTHAWAHETEKRSKLNDRIYNKDGTSSSYYEVPKQRELSLQSIQDIENDHMFSKTKRHVRQEMPGLIQKSKRFKNQLLSVKSFLTSVEAYCQKLQKMIMGDTAYNPIKTLTSPDKLLKQVFADDPLFVQKIKCGFVQDFDVEFDKYMTKISDKVAGKIKEPKLREHFKTKMTEFVQSISESRQNSKYNYEVIVQYGKSAEVEKASSYLKNRYEMGGKTVVHLSYHDGFFESKKGYWYDVQLLKKTRITVVGHGSHTQQNFKIAGRDATALADDILKQVIVKQGDEQISLGKISLVACNEDELNRKSLQQGTTYGKELIRALDNENIDSVVSIRNGKIQVTEDGMKLYGAGDGKDFHLRKKPPVMVKDSQSGTQYKTIDISEKEWKFTDAQWSSELPTVQEDTKVLIVSEYRDSYDLEYDVKQSKLSSIEDFSGKSSGFLDFNGQDIMTDSNSDILGDQSKIYIDSEYASPDKIPLLDGVGVESSLVQLEAKDTVNRLSIATSEAVNLVSDSIPENWIPIIDTAVKDDNGHTKVTMMNFETYQTQDVSIKNDAFVQFKKTSKKLSMNVNNLPTFSKTSIGMSGAGGLLGLGGFIYSAIQLSRAQRCKENVTCPATKGAKQLVKALEINAYISLAEGTFGVVTDSVQIAELAVSFKLSKNAVNGVATMTKSTSKFLQVSKVLGNIGTGVGAVGGVVSLGFSGYQLAHAQTKAHKIEFGIQVGIDSVNVAVSAVAIGTAIAATVTTSATVSAIAAAAGPVGFAVAIVGILASTITSLVFEFKNTRKNAGQVGEYFWQLDQVYAQKGFHFDSSSGTFKILDHAIIKEVDFETGIIILDSQYIYRTRHGKTGSGKKNYFFWYKDFPKMIQDQSQAINIRLGIQGGSNSKSMGSSRYRAKQLILPVIPKSYISYEYNRLPFCTAMHDKGFDIIRRLEQDYRFDYDFYIVPGEQIITSISNEYVKTKLTIKLRDNIKILATQKIPDSLQNKYTFHLITKSRQHTLLISDGYSFELESSSGACSWNVDYNNGDVDFDNIEFSSPGQVKLGKSFIKVISRGDHLYVTDTVGGILDIDAHSKSKHLTHVVQSKTTTSEELKRYLRNSNNWLKGQQYIVISSFTHRGKYVGKAYYDIKLNLFLFSDYQGAIVSNNFKEKVQLLGKFENDVYFMGEENNQVIIWRTNADTKHIDSTYHLYCGNTGFQVTKLGMQEHAVILIQNVFDVSLIYMIYPKEIKLIFIDGKEEDIHKLGDTCFPTLNEFLPKTEKLRAGNFPGKCLYASSIPILPLKQTVRNGLTNHFWLYMKESEIPDSNPNRVFCAPSKPPVATGIIRPNINNECDDLTLRDIQQLQSGEEIYYFYCEKAKNLFYQVHMDPAVEVFVPGGIDRIEEFGTVKLIKSHNGGMYKFTESGNFSLVALSFEYIANKQDWIDAFKTIAEEALVESFIPILHLQNIDKKTLTAWYDVNYERLIIVSPGFDAEDITYIGPSPSSYLVWLYSSNKQEIMLQTVLNDKEIAQMTHKHNGNAFWRERRLPAGKVVLDNVNSAEYMQGGVFAVTNEGVMLHVDHFSAFKLLGVNVTWISNNKMNLENRLNVLCKKYHSSDIITLGQENAEGNEIIYKWHHCALQSQLLFSLEENNEPAYLGTNMDQRIVYFVVGDDIVKIDTNNTRVKSQKNVDSRYSIVEKVVKVLMSEVRGKTMLLQPAESYLLNDIPMLDQVISLVIGMDYGLEVILEAVHWLHYESIVVTHTGTAGPQISYLTIHPPYHCSYEFEEIENDTMINDPISNRKIILEDFTRQAGKMDQEYLPVDNEAVISVQICDHEPVTFVSNRERYSPAVAMALESKDNDSQSVGYLVIVVYVVGAVLSLLVVFELSVLVVEQSRKRLRKNKDNIVRDTTNIRINEQPQENEVSL